MRYDEVTITRTTRTTRTIRTTTTTTTRIRTTKNGARHHLHGL
jgi:hypothetical protein